MTMLTTKRLTLFLLAILPLSNHALEVIRVNIEHDSTSKSIDIQLFDNIAINTVNNFLSYVDDGSYEGIFINRSVENFVVQTGGYSFDQSLGNFTISNTGQYNGGLQPVSAKATIRNEFSLSNLRGTLAMAKISGIADSASNEWFINLTDNTFLDNTNGGFTVFGQVLGNGMTIVDEAASIPVYDLSTQLNNSGDFLKTPLTNFDNSLTVQDITNKNLVLLKDFRYLYKITDTVDFGDANPGNPIQKSIVISNTSDNVLAIGNFDSVAISPTFTVLNDDCSSTTLLVSDTCNIDIEFAPVTTDYFESEASINIQTYNHTFPIILKTPGPDIYLSRNNVDFGFQPIYDSADGLPEQAVIYVNNDGDRDLSISAINFSSSAVEEFEFIDNCTTENNDYLPGKVQSESFCILVINFLPNDLFVKSATITIISDDPNEPELTINVTGGSNTDNDGVDSTIEDAAPNNGDGNFDGSPDRLQDNVVSFAGANGVYTTLLADKDVLFTNVQAVQLSTIEALPDGTILDNESFSFELSGFPSGSIAEFGMILPAGNSPTNIYAFGPTADNNTPHWYALEKNTTPGTYIFGDISLLGASGESVSRNVTSIRILDGGDGDSDQLANGTIVFVGGPEIVNQSSSTSGSLLWMLFLLPISIVIYRR